MVRKKCLLLLGLMVVAVFAGCTQSKGGAPEAASEWEYGRYMYVNNGGGTVSVIDSKTDKVIATLIAGRGATLQGLTPDGKKLYVGDADGYTFHIYDAVNLKTIKDIKTGDGPKDAIVSPDGKWVITNHRDELKAIVFDPVTDKEIKTITFEQKNTGYTGPVMTHSAWSWDSKYYFCQNYADRVAYVLEAPDFNVVATIEVDSPTHYFLPKSDNKEVWLVQEGYGPARYKDYGPGDVQPSVVVVDLETFKIKKQITIPLQEGEPIEGHHGTFTNDEKYFYYANRGPGPAFGGTTVVVIDTSTYEIVKTFQAADGVGHAYMTIDDRYVIMTPYGHSGAGGSNVITILDQKTHKRIKDLQVGEGLGVRHIATTIDGKKGYVSNSDDSAVYVVDMDTLEITKKIRTGKIATEITNTYTNIFETVGYPGGDPGPGPK